MDILAAMFAYLGCVTGIIGALGVSLFVFFGHPGQQMDSTLAVATKPGVVLAAAETSTESASSSTLTRGTTKVGSAPIQKLAANTPKIQISPAPKLRRLVEEPKRRFAYQQDQAFEARFLGYAD